MTIVFATGATGGHVYPLIAVAQELSEYTCVFLGTQNRKDSEIVPTYGFAFRGLPSPKTPLGFLRSFVQAWKTLAEVKAQIIIGSGGGSTVPTILAAWLKRVPIFLLEQNVLPGRTNRALQFFAKKIVISFPESRRYFHVKHVECFGNPVRKHFSPGSDGEVKALKFGDGPKILVLGGSQGAYAINQFFESNEAFFVSENFVLIHLMGEAYYRKRFGSQPFQVVYSRDKSLIKVVKLPYFEAMDDLYTMADLVVSRAGATTIAEILHFQKPSVLIPYPHAKDNHQQLNAQWVCDQKLGKLMVEGGLDLTDMISYLQDCLAKPVSFPPKMIAAKRVAEAVRGMNS